MQITFRRSGGLGGLPGLMVDDSVDLDDTPPRVTAPSTGYGRPLDAAEAGRLRRAAAVSHGLDATTAALVDWLPSETDRIRQHRQGR